MLALTSLVLFSACGEVPEPVESSILASHDDSGVTLMRVGSGGFVAGETITFEAKLDDHVDASSLQWTVSDGELVGDGLRVRWTLPARGGKHQIHVRTNDMDGTPTSASFQLGAMLARAYPTDRQGEVYVGPSAGDVVASTCALAFDSSDRPSIAFSQDTHGQLLLATFGTAWSIDFVDGPGFDVGSTISNRFDMKIDSAGAHHLAYAYHDRGVFDWEVWWASDQGGSWTRERVSNSYDHLQFAWPSIALDPSIGDRPAVVHSQDTSYDSMVVSYQTGPGTWVQNRFSESNYSQYHTGGAAYQSDGTLWATKGLTSHGHASWTEGGGWSNNSFQDWSSNAHMHAQMIVNDADEPVMMHANGLEHRVGTSWRHSEIEPFEMEYFDLAWGGGKPHVAVIHDGNLELITTDADGYWEYTVIATNIGDITPGVAVDSDGDPHVCYQKADGLYYY